MKIKNITVLFLSLIIIFGTMNFSVSAANEAEIQKLSLYPYCQMKYVRSEKTLSGISPNTSLNTVLNSFKNKNNITVYNHLGEKVTSGNVGTGWQFTNNNSGETAHALIFGDINCDSKVGLLDLLEAQLYLLTSKPLDDFQKKALDLNHDNEYNLKDCLLLKKHIAKWFEIRNSSLYYVSKTGDDENEGSIDSPFLTIQKAANVMTAGDTCLIREGIYRECVIPKNEGEEGAPITFKAYENEKVTVSGNEKVTGKWQVYKNGIYKTNFNLWRRTENQLFINGKPAQIARYPNKQDDNMISVGTVLSADNATSNSLSDTNLNQEQDFFKNAKIFIEGTSHYLYYSSTVTASSKESISFNDVAGGWDAPCANSNYYFYDSLNLLDTNNEWYYDPAGILYFMPEIGKTPDKLDIEYSVRDLAFDLRDKSYITIKEIEIFGANVKTNKGSDNLNLDENRILYYYHTMLSRYYPWEAEWYGLELWGKNSVVQNCEIAYSAEGGVEIYADNCSVVNNYIHDINYINCNAAAIEPKYCENTLISHNTIDSIARSAIILACKNMRVSYNKISNCAVNTYDVSGIGSYKFDAMNTVEVDHNVIFDSNNNHAFVAYYLDNGSMNFLLHHNVCYNVDLSMILNNPSYGNKIYNNTFLSDNPISTGNMQNPFENNAFIGAVWNGDQFYNNIMPSLYYGTGAYYSNNMLCTNQLLKLNKDCTLSLESNAIDNGLSIPFISDKFCGKTVDIGAYEYGSAPWQAGQNNLTTNNLNFSLSEQPLDFPPIKGKAFLELKNNESISIIENSDFENTTEGWGGFNYKNIKGNASSGEYAIELENGWIERTIDVKPGQMYIYSGDIKVGEFETVTEFGVHFMDNQYNIKRQGAFMVTATSYNTFETVFTIPEDCTKMRIFAACWQPNKKIYADNIKCKLIK